MSLDDEDVSFIGEYTSDQQSDFEFLKSAVGGGSFQSQLPPDGPGCTRNMDEVMADDAEHADVNCVTERG